MFETDIKNLASAIVAQALKEGTSFQDKVDAFKAVTTYYGLLLKNRDSADAEQVPAGPSFLDFSEAVAGDQDGRSKAVRTGSGRRARPRADS
jgi:hypothetical protein